VIPSHPAVAGAPRRNPLTPIMIGYGASITGQLVVTLTRYAGASPPVWANSLLTTFQVPSMRASWR
jgi:hypothetical protein